MNINDRLTLKFIESIEEGIIVLFAAGNCGNPCGNSTRCKNWMTGMDCRGYGKSILAANGHPETIAVGAVNVKEEYVGYSSQGPSIFGAGKPDFCAITHFQGYYDRNTPFRPPFEEPFLTRDGGTSAATPIAAGVIALLKQAFPSLTHQQAKSVLKETAKPFGPTISNYCSGSGIIRPKEAFEKIKMMVKI